MYFYVRNLYLRGGLYSLCHSKTAMIFKCFCHKPSQRRNESHVKLLQNILGCTYHQAYAILKKHPKLETTDTARITKAAYELKETGLSRDDFKMFPKVLTMSPTVIEQYSLILKESGFTDVRANVIMNYRVFVKKRISLLKAYGYLPENSNVCEKLLLCLNAPDSVKMCAMEKLEPEEDVDNCTVSLLRKIVLSCYLQWRLGASEKEVAHIFSAYAGTRHRSLRHIYESLSIFLEELNFSKKQIIEHGCVLQTHPGDLRRIMEDVPFLNGEPIKNLISRHPVVATTSYETFIQILKILKDAGISEAVIVDNPTIFCFSVENVKQGIKSFDSKATPPEFKALRTHRKMLRLVVSHDQVIQRLNYLNSSNSSPDLPAVASLNVLCGAHKLFENYVSTGGGQTRGMDVINYLVKALGSQEDEEVFSVKEDKSASSKDLSSTIRASLKKNIHWRAIPLSEIQSCLDMLFKHGFTKKEIISSIQILLYSSRKVEEQLNKLLDMSKPSNQPCTSDGDGIDLVSNNCDEEESDISEEVGFDPTDYDGPHLANRYNSLRDGAKKIKLNFQRDRKYYLPLCLYFLEKEYRFSGDGVWFR